MSGSEQHKVWRPTASPGTLRNPPLPLTGLLPWAISPDAEGGGLRSWPGAFDLWREICLTGLGVPTSWLLTGNHYLLRITAFMFEFIQLKVIIILLSLKEFWIMGVKKKYPLMYPLPKNIGEMEEGEGWVYPPHPPRARLGLGINNSVLKYLSHWPKKTIKLHFQCSPKLRWWFFF